MEQKSERAKSDGATEQRATEQQINGATNGQRNEAKSNRVT